MNEPRLEYSEKSEISRTLFNFIEQRRVQTIPNILRRRSRSSLIFNSIDRASTNFIKERIETLFNLEFGIIINPINTINVKRVNCTKNVEKKDRKRKQIICPKALIYDDENWNVCNLDTLSEADTEKMDNTVISSLIEDNENDSKHFVWSQCTNDYEESSASQNFHNNTVLSATYNDLKYPAIAQFIYNKEMSSACQISKDWKISPTSYSNHKVSSQDTDQISLPSLISSLHSPLEIYSNDNNNNWMDIQSIIEVDMKQKDTDATENFTNDINSQFSKYFQKKNTFFYPTSKDNYSLLNMNKQISRYCCFMCEKTYKSKASLHYHLKHIHNFYYQTPEVPKVLTCKWCFKDYRRINAYKKHLINHLNKET